MVLNIVLAGTKMTGKSRFIYPPLPPRLGSLSSTRFRFREIADFKKLKRRRNESTAGEIRRRSYSERRARRVS